MSNTSTNEHTKQNELPSRPEYFGKVAASMLSMYRLLYKHLPKDWKNVKEHCLVEAARARTLGPKVGLDQERTGLLAQALLAHDFFKAEEKKIVSNDGIDENGKPYTAFSREAFEEAGRKQNKLLQDAEVDPRIILLINSVGHSSLQRMRGILTQIERGEEITQQELAELTAHFIDDMSSGADRANPAFSDENGKTKNQMVERMEKNHQNERYKGLNEAGLSPDRFNKLTFDEQLEVGVEIQEYLASRVDSNMNPMELPAFIDSDVEEQFVKPRRESTESPGSN